MLKKGATLAVKGFSVFQQETGFQNEKTRGGVIFLVADHLAAIVSKESCRYENQIWLRLTGTEDGG